MKTPILTIVAVVAGLFCARAELLVYDLSFNTVGKSVNYSFIEGGYLVVDAATKSVTSIVILTDPATRLAYYTTGLLDGTYMEMIEEGSGSEYGVIYSTAGSGGNADNIAFQILGKTSQTMRIGAGNSLSIPRKLSGYMVASGAESTSLDNSQLVTFSFGFAGSSKVTSNLQSGLTNDANNSRLTAADELEVLIEVLKNRGIVPQPTPEPTASPTASPTATISL
jgi:hypothetical protein